MHTLYAREIMNSVLVFTRFKTCSQTVSAVNKGTNYNCCKNNAGY